MSQRSQTVALAWRRIRGARMAEARSARRVMPWKRPGPRCKPPGSITTGNRPCRVAGLASTRSYELATLEQTQRRTEL
jgi:hypothetical protein